MVQVMTQYLAPITHLTAPDWVLGTFGEWRWRCKISLFSFQTKWKQILNDQKEKNCLIQSHWCLKYLYLVYHIIDTVFLMLLFLFMHKFFTLFENIYLIELQRETSSICWFSTEMIAKARIRNHILVSHLIAWTKVFGSFSAAFPGVSAGSLVRWWADGSRTSTPIWNAVGLFIFFFSN